MNFPACYALPATATYPRAGQRRLHWFAGATNFEMLGTLTIVQGRRDAETYEIEADVDDYTTADCRAWLLNRTTGEITTERLGTYRVECNRGGWRCSCTGAMTRKNTVSCKHVQSVQVLDAEGEFDRECEVEFGGSGMWFEDEVGEATQCELEGTVVR